MSIEAKKDACSTQFAFVKRHSRISGVIALPVYGNPPADNPKYPNGTNPINAAVLTPCKIVRLHAPIENLVVTWTATKEGAAPAVPNPYLFDTNSVFSHGARSPACPIDKVGYSGHIWHMSGEYYYHLIAPVDLNSTMVVGITPWETNISVNDSIIPNYNFLSTLLEPRQSTYRDPQYQSPILFLSVPEN